MEERINVAELLKDCPKGMELDCTMYNKVTLLNVDDGKNRIFPIKVLREDEKIMTLTKYGQYTNEDFAKCVIFPKGKTTWEGFEPPCKFKDGDVVATASGHFAIISNKTSEGIYSIHCIAFDWGSFTTDKMRVHPERLATEEEKAELFQTIKDNGYRWNSETKTLEKIEPKFKVGDRVKSIFNNTQYKITELTDTYYTLEEVTNKFLYRQPIYEVVNWELVPDKFDITNLKPFDKVLVRCGGAASWEPQFFSKYEPNIRLPFKCTYNNWAECIPYEANKHLCDTTNDCDEYYKTWE
jgi:hypothetical protein